MGNKKKPAVLRRRSDFFLLKKTGKRVSPNSWMVLNYRENGTQDLRLGWTIPKFVGNAVLRNRLKRWGREFIREFHNRPSSRDRGFDVNIVLRRRSKEFYKELRRKEFDVALEKAFRRITAA